MGEEINRPLLGIPRVLREVFIVRGNARHVLQAVDGGTRHTHTDGIHICAATA